MNAATDTAVFGFSDEARRISDTIQQAIVDGARNKWIAFNLEDGRTDGTKYDTKADAIRHHGNRYGGFMYIKVPWDMCTPRAAEVFLRVHRQLKKIGQHPDDEMAKHEFMLDTRREAYPSLDRRKIMKDLRRPGERRTSGGVILP